MRACKQQWHGRKQTWNFLLRQVLHNPQCDSNGTLAVVLFCGKTHKMSSYQSLKHPSGIFSNCSCLCERIYLEIVRKVKPSGEPGPVGRHKVKQSQSNTKVSSNCWLFFFFFCRKLRQNESKQICVQLWALKYRYWCAIFLYGLELAGFVQETERKKPISVCQWIRIW